MTDLTGTTTYTYEPLTGRLQSKQTPQGTLSYTYDVAGNLKTTQSSNTSGLGGGTSVTYTYDELNRLKSAADANGTTTYNYDSVGNLQNFIYPNGVTHTYTYDELNRLKELCVAAAALGCATGAQAKYTYTLGPSGNRMSVAELSGRMVTYGYDDLYRLTSESIACVTGSSCASQLGNIGYSYDQVGNRTAMTSTVANLTPSGLLLYDANDRQTTEANEAYDANGNTASSGSVANIYDFENKLVQRGTISIVYDGDGNRVRKTAGGVTTRYLVDTNNLTGYAQVLDEVEGSTVQRTYTYGLDLISQRLTTSGQRLYYSYDGHGSVRQLTDASGNVTDTYTYDAFGNLLERTGNTPNLYLYAGEQFDPDLGLYYNRARYLDVRQGRFLTMDEHEGSSIVPLSLHRYLYALNDPANNIDPTDLITDSILAALYGQRVHELIGIDFEFKTGGFSNRSISTIAGIPNYLRPDLVNLVTGEVYEIKPTGRYAEGLAQLALYLGVLNILDPQKRRWIPGFTYFPPTVLQLTPVTLAFVQVPIGGVITYNVRNLALDVAIVTLSATYAVAVQFSAATLTYRYA